MRQADNYERLSAFDRRLKASHEKQHQNLIAATKRGDALQQDAEGLRAAFAKAKGKNKEQQMDLKSYQASNITLWERLEVDGVALKLLRSQHEMLSGSNRALREASARVDQRCNNLEQAAAADRDTIEFLQRQLTEKTAALTQLKATTRAFCDDVDGQV